MKESISNSYVFSVVIVVIGVCTTLIVTSMNYSKVFKMKNRVIEIIERNGTYNDYTVGKQIEEFLRASGYPPYPSNKVDCPDYRKNDSVIDDSMSAEELGLVNVNHLHNYRYCIYQYKTAKGSYYSVILFMSLDFPIIGDFLRVDVPMHGDTKIIFDY